jgi:hypothetical protein
MIQNQGKPTAVPDPGFPIEAAFGIIAALWQRRILLRAPPQILRFYAAIVSLPSMVSQQGIIS